MNVKVIKQSQIKKEGKWINDGEASVEFVNYDYFQNIVSPATLSFFKSIGGKEVLVKKYVNSVLTPVKLYSTNPFGDKRSVYEFDFREGN